MMFALLTAHIDLSIGATVSFAAVFWAKLISTNEGIMMNPYLAMLVVLFFCVIIGTANGLLVVKTNMPALIATMATSTVLEGVNYLITDAKPISKIDESIYWIGQSYVGKIPMPVIVFGVIVIVAGVILGFTYIGRYIYATGSNSEAARLAGLNTDMVNVARLHRLRLSVRRCGLRSLQPSSFRHGDDRYPVPEQGADLLRRRRYFDARRRGQHL